MSSSALNIGSSALLAAQRALETASHNVANATNTNYTRQRVQISSAAPTPANPGMRGNGVVMQSIERLRDGLADAAFRGAASTAAASTARTGVLSRAQNVIGTYPGGLTSDLSAFFASFDNLSLSPADPSAREGVINAGQTLASTLRDASRQLDTLRTDTGYRVIDQVAEINALALNVAALNSSIADATNSGQQPNDLLDQRDGAVDRLAAMVGGVARPGGNHSLDVYVGGSILVSGDDVRALSVGTGGLTAGFVDGGQFRPGGELGANLGLIAKELPGFQAQLDSIADGFATAVNDLQASGYDYEGRPGIPFFGGTGGARGISVNPELTFDRIAAGQTPPLPGPPPVPVRQDGNNALALAALRTAATVTLPNTTSATTVGDAVRAVGGALGTAAAEAARSEQRNITSRGASETQRAQVNGVSIDEEMVQLVKFQHAYQAAAKVITTADDMMQTLIGLVR